MKYESYIFDLDGTLLNTHLPPDCIQNDIRLKALSPFEITCGLVWVSPPLHT